MPYRRPATFDTERARAWLTSPAIVEPDGEVRSWHSHDNPGYRYPEAAGLLLSLLGRHPVSDRIAQRCLTRLVEDEVGRDGTRYLFDEGVVLAGLIRYGRAGGRLEVPTLAPLYRRFIDRLAAREVTDRELAPRWSTRAGPHLLKLAVTVGAWTDVGARDRAVLAVLLDEAGQRCEAGRFITGPDDRRTYVHAHCYATEGALRLALPDLGAALVRERATRLGHAGAAWLASVQRPDGGLPAWHDGAHGWGPEPSDVAAQAIRIWTLADPERYAGSIDRALRFVDALATVEGAVRYHAASSDLNTWATAFAIQALDLAAPPRRDPGARFAARSLL